MFSSKKHPAILALLLCLLVATAEAKHKKPGKNTPGHFDYYLLTLSWAPQFCSSHGSSASPTECDPQKHFGFVVHGLWPENTNGSYPQSCSTAKQVSQDIIDQMMPIMPDAGLMQHEWSKHGTCSGLSMQDYFNDIQKTFQQLQIPQEYRAPQQTVSARPSDIQQKFADTNNAPRNAFVVGCTGSQFEQLQVCLTKDLQYRQCGSGLQKCTRSQIQIRPTP